MAKSKQKKEKERAKEMQLMEQKKREMAQHKQALKKPSRIKALPARFGLTTIKRWFTE